VPAGASEFRLPAEPPRDRRRCCVGLGASGGYRSRTGSTAAQQKVALRLQFAIVHSKGRFQLVEALLGHRPP